ncbi:unnamed protein product [Pylaiella littoralis]
MTVDNSQVARRDVIILNEEKPRTATAVLVTGSVGSERGVADEHTCICNHKVTQSEYNQAHKLATSLRYGQLQHQQVTKPSYDDNVEDSGHNSDTTSAVSSMNSDDDDSDVASTTGSSSNESNDGGSTAVEEEEPRQQIAVPKWVRVGEKVCFSTVVAAVLIPSSHDLAASAKRELWWQPADYADFRVNYATHMHDPSIELREQEREEKTIPAPAATVATNAGTPAGSGDTATVEGVLVVAAAPAPAPLAPRSVNRGVDPRRVGGSSGGWRASGGVAAPCQQDRPSKATRRERNVRHHPQQQQQPHLHKNVQGRRRMSGRPGFATLHHAAHVMPQQYNGTQPLQQQAAMMQRGHAGSGYVTGVGRHDARHDPYAMAPLRANSDMTYHHPHHNYHHHQQQYDGRAAPGAHHGQQHNIFVNGNPAGVSCPPQQQPQPRMGAAPPGILYHGGNNGNSPALVQAFMPAHAVLAGGFRGVSVTPAAFSSRGCGDMGPSPIATPPPCAVGGGHMPLTVPVANPSHFSMWRSQLMFAPVMHMQ